MTAILGVWSSPDIYGMAADRQVTGEDGDMFFVKKLYRQGDYILGVSGDSTVGFCAEAVLDGLAKRKTQPFKKSITRAWCKALHTLSQAGESAKQRSDHDLRMLLVGPQGLFFFDSSANGYVEEIAPDDDGEVVHGTGVGGDSALQAWRTMSPIPMEEMLEEAVQIACKYNAMCGGPIDVEVGDGAE